MSYFCCHAAKNAAFGLVACVAGAWGTVGLVSGLESAKADDKKAPPVVTPGPFVEAPPPEGAIVLGMTDTAGAAGRSSRRRRVGLHGRGL